jgi:HK97 family phage major capsid protein
MIPDLMRDHVIGKRHFRSTKVDRAKIDAEAETIPMTFSSDYPVVRWWGIEVLSHAPEAMVLDRWKQGAPFLKNHDSYDQRGIILNGDFVLPFLQGNVKFSRNTPGQELKTDIVDGICPYTSVGYDVHHVRELLPEEMSPEVKDLCLANECKAYLVDKWEPVEGSSVWLGANPNVGARDIDYRDGVDEEKIMELLSNASEERQRSHSNPPITIKERAHDVEPKTPEQIAQEEAVRIAEIEAIGRNFGSRIAGGKEAMDQLTKDAVELKRSAELFRGDVYTRVADGQPLESPLSLLGLSPKEQKRYSIVNALLYQIDGKGGEFERECSDAIAVRAGNPKNAGLYLPYDVQKRDLVAGTPASGGYLVGTESRPQDFITLLRNALIQGVTYLPGLSQNVQIPKQTGGATITVAATEGADFSETAQTFDQITLSPHDIGGFVEVSRRLLIQANPAIDNLIAVDLAQQLALKMNYLMLYGSGGSGEPTGAFKTANIGTFNAASATWPLMLEPISDIGTANVVGNLQWLLNSTSKVLLMSREKAYGFPMYIMGEDGKMAGYNAQISEQIGNGHLALAKMDEIIVGEFGMMELVYDRSTASKSGGLRIAVYHSMDSALRHPGALSYADNLS